MSDLMHTLLDDTRRQEHAAERRDDSPIKSVPRIVEPATRADRIIAAGDAVRVQYRAANYLADTGMVYSAQIGYLHGEVRRLCDEIDAQRNPDAFKPGGMKLAYIDVRADAVGNALVRCFYDADPDGDGDLIAVFLGGFELTLGLNVGAIEALEVAMRNERAVYIEAEKINAAIARSEA